MSFNTLSTASSFRSNHKPRIGPSGPTQFATFSTIISVGSFQSVKSLSTSGYNNACIATDYARKKMLVVICNATTSYVAYSKYVSGAWSTVTTLIAAGGGQLFPGVVLSGDGTKGLIIGTTTTYSIDWSSTNPTSSTIESTSTHGYNSCCILPDGLKVLLGCYPTGLYYSTWNSGTSKFNTGTTCSGAGSIGFDVGFSIYPNLSVILFNNTSNSWNLTWANFNNSTNTVSSVTSCGIQEGERGIALVGGGASSAPTNIILSCSNSFGKSNAVSYATFNSTTKAIGTRTNVATTAQQCSLNSISDGRRIYYITSSALGYYDLTVT